MKQVLSSQAYDHHRGRAPLLRPSPRGWVVLFLAIALGGYVLVNAFWQYLLTGRWWSFAPADYQRDLAVPLGQTLLQPLSIFTHPWMILVMGLLLAAVVFVPIIVAVMYRLCYMPVFVLAVIVAGHAPVMALALASGCLLAALTRLRSNAPFLAVLLGTIPVVVYFYLANLTGTSSAATLPMQRWAPYAPFLIAVVAAVLASAVVLALARLTGFRPGVVWPVLSVMLAAPMAIFYAKVGTDELDCSLITMRLAPGDAILDSVPLDVWIRTNGAEGLDRTRQVIQVKDDLKARKRELSQQCEAFMDKHPTSQRAAGVMFLAAQCHNLQLDEPALHGSVPLRHGLTPQGEGDPGLVKYGTSFQVDSEVSRKAWRRLREAFASSPQAALADWRLGELALRSGAVPEAYQRLRAAARRLEEIVANFDKVKASEKEEKIFAPACPMPTHRYYKVALFEVKRLIWLIDENDVLNDTESAKALSEYLSANSHELSYYERLAELAGRHERTPMGDNLKLAVALATCDPYQQVLALMLLARGGPQTDAAVEATYELGRLAGNVAAVPRDLQHTLPQELKKPEWYFQQVKAARPNPWQGPAEESLTWRKSASQPKEKP